MLFFGWFLTVLALVLSMVEARLVPNENAVADDPYQTISDHRSILCRIRIVDVDFLVTESNETAIAKQPENRMYTVCITSSITNSPQTYFIHLPSEMMAGNVSTHDLVRIQGPVQVLENVAQIVATNQTEWDVISETPEQEQNERHLRNHGSIQTLLVIRVTYMGKEPSVTALELQGRVFGRGPDRVVHSLRSQMEACSQGKYRIRIPPAHAAISGGVLEVTLNTQVVYGDNSAMVLENQVMVQATSILGHTLMNRLRHVVIVLPQHSSIRFGNNDQYLAYGYVGERVTVFRDHWAGTLSALMHEVGHNIGFSHSGRGELEYGDTSGFMGYGVDQVNGPLMCFNGQKHYLSGWYDGSSGTRHVFIDDLPFTGYLAFFGDYEKIRPNEPVILSFFLPGGWKARQRFFLQYNLAQGMNAGTRSSANAVTIVRDDGGLGDFETTSLESWWVGSISKNVPGIPNTARYDHPKFGQVVFQVCQRFAGSTDKAAKVKVSIYFNNGIQSQGTTCDKKILPYCDDDPSATFYVNPDLGERTCGWLARHIHVPWVQTQLCHADHDAHRFCPETCGACLDDCRDRLDWQFWVNANVGWQTCHWLATLSSSVSQMLFWKEKLCVPGHDAFRLCAESCDRCD